MADFLLWIITASGLSLFWVRFIDKRMYNPVIARCGTCQAKMYLHPRGKAAFVGLMAWLTLSYLTVWRFNPPFILGEAVLLVLAIPANIAANRTYHAYWRWRHPLRCDGGGHLKPAPTHV
jgi:hypothetical protein